ncbi:hypothetical protein SARC_16461 [Sphaeroforma arctica JP610]|uniref:Uncharacterized protein n=1 Tax=Sphaeroforma arctica JP610 TaxID=667725 RepID=A0A0L0F2U3_9EUKA|nr:hypothetical protein SARC_16461 [Sphaeroforma arctica JP610]KNC71007.1 hypothetical protein SARC_16461 [Sphaeroforma arctica JP610]|eukprot:XP_014144909.1 hypothetical protein SARC_16461 [Sphaeroforma arctica JP610]
MNNEQNIQAAQQRLEALLQQLDQREQALREHQQRDERKQPDPRAEVDAIRLEIEKRGYAVPGPGRGSLFKLRVEIPGVSASDHINNTLQNPALSESDWSTGTALETNTGIWCRDNIRYKEGLSDAPTQTPDWYKGQRPAVIKELDNIINWAIFFSPRIKTNSSKRPDSRSPRRSLQRPHLGSYLRFRSSGRTQGTSRSKGSRFRITG